MFIKLRKKILHWLQAAEKEEYICVNREGSSRFGLAANRLSNLFGSTVKRGSDCVVSDSESNELNGQHLKFKLIPGSGGVILEIRKYDSTNDHYIYVHYIIPEEKELGEELAKIITLQSLR